MSDLPAVITDAMSVLQDREASIENRGAMYALLHQIQLRINRALKTAKDDLIVHLETSGTREMGPLSVKATAIDVKWPANDESNWGDAQVQDAMAEYAKVAPDYFRHVPEHWEVRTAELGAGVAAGDPLARRLHNEMKAHGWRTEEGRRLSLAVREVTPRKAA